VCMCVCVWVKVYVCVYACDMQRFVSNDGQYVLCIFIGHFPKKRPILSGFFTKRDLQFQASYVFLPPRKQ